MRSVLITVISVGLGVVAYMRLVELLAEMVAVSLGFLVVVGNPRLDGRAVRAAPVVRVGRVQIKTSAV